MDDQNQEYSQDRRKYKRVPCNALMVCRMANPGKQEREEFLEISPPKTVDISSGGMQMETDTPIMPGLSLIIFLSIQPIEIPIEIRARSVWCKAAEENKFRVGIEFLQFTEEKDRQSIEDFIAKNL
ncbi:MAG: PilZ domain-containing protein [bacterium]|nr:PilZ domain-containing protein [bacterium]